MKALIKYARFEGNKVVLIPTAEGNEYLKKFGPPTLSSTDKKIVKMEEGTEQIGGKDGVELIAFVGEVESDIQHFKEEIAPPLNTFQVRVHTISAITWILNMPFGNLKKEEPNTA